MLNTENSIRRTRGRSIICRRGAVSGRRQSLYGRKRCSPCCGVLALLVGALGIGTTLPDPKSSDAYMALAGEKASVE